VDLANGSAERAFQLGTDAVTGRATHQITGGPGGVDEATYIALRRQAGYRLSAPIVEDYVTVRELDDQPIRLLGIDPFAEAPFRSYLGSGSVPQSSPQMLADLLARPNTALISLDVAAEYGLQPGDTLTASYGGRPFQLTIAGLLAPYDDLSRRAMETLLLVDISTAQEVLGRVGRLDRIDLIIPDGDVGQQALALVQGYLSDNEVISSSAARQGVVEEMTAAFRLNLAALSLLALVVGMFLIYNTVTFSVVQRRPVIGSLRALGMTQRSVFGLILVEALILGALGTTAGLALGIILGRGAVQLVSQTINDLFFVVSVREVDVPSAVLVKGALTGLAASAFAAIVPALEATSVPPAGAMRRSNVEERTRSALRWVTAAGVALLAAGALLLAPDWGVGIAFAGLFAVILGSALLTPMLTWVAMRAVGVAANRTGRRAGVIARMAPRYVNRSLSRTSIAVAALMVSVSAIIGVGVMIGSFRGAVREWLGDVLQADIYVSPPSLNANQVTADLDPSILDAITGFPGIARMVTSHGVDVRILGSQPNSDGDEEPPVRVVSVSEDLAGPHRRYLSAVGDWRQTWAAVEKGGVIVNEPLANRMHLAVGDSVSLATDHGVESFPIEGVTVDFDVRSVVFMHAPIFQRYWDDTAVSAVGLFVAPGVDVDEKVQEIRRSLAGGQEVLVRSNVGMRAEALAVFDRTFAITIALQVLATFVAFIGILSTLMSLQLERTREIGILRANGMTRGQLWRLSLYETGLIGSSAGLIAIPTGIVLAAVLIYIINLRSFGWSMQMQLAPVEFVRALSVAVGAALLAGLYPAWRAGRIEPATAIRSE
jgi:putative ABC transport system permease protein